MNRYLRHLLPPDPLVDITETPATAEDWDAYVEALDVVATAFPPLRPDVEPRLVAARARAATARQTGNVRANVVTPGVSEGDPAKDVRQEAAPAPAVPLDESLGMGDRQLGQQAPQR